MAENQYGLCMNCMSKLSGEICDSCGFDSRQGQANGARALPPTSRLANGQYLVGNVLSENSEGLTYMGLDLQTHQKVWIREFMPEGMAVREQNLQVVTDSVFSTQFKTLKIDFSDIHMSLKNMKDTSGIIPVVDCFEQNNTIYSVQEYIQCISLENFLGTVGGKLDYQQIGVIFESLFDYISELHMNNIVHRGISPQTIVLDPEGDLRLTGFCISSVRTGKSELVAELFPGYTAPEQYNVTNWQGTWTDVYASAAVLYTALTGVVPPEAIRRRHNDTMQSAVSVEPAVPEHVSEAISKAMIVVPENRVETMESFKALLVHGSDEYRKRDMTKQVDLSKGVQPQRKRRKKSKSAITYTLAAMFVTSIVLLCAIYFGVNALSASELLSPNTSSEESDHLDEDDPEGTESAQSSDEDDTYLMPNFVDRYMDNVYRDQGYLNGFFTVRSDEEHSETVPAGRIMEQSVESGEKLTAGNTVVVTFKVSKGPYELPEMEGWTLEAAEKYFEDLGEDAGIVVDYIEEHHDEVSKGRVIRSYRAGSKFTIVVSLGREVIEEPSQAPDNNSNNNESSGGNYWDNWGNYN